MEENRLRVLLVSVLGYMVLIQGIVQGHDNRSSSHIPLLISSEILPPFPIDATYISSL